jgi:glyoxylase-like metal-dependent hydrolase (beta-lactamase superfamily II)
MEIAPGVRRIGDGTVNAYLIEDAGSVTIVDAGLPGYWHALPGELRAMGRALGDVRAVLLTHGHSDHIGFADRARRDAGIGVRVHELDAALARGEAPNPAKGLGPVRPGPFVAFFVLALRNG